MATNSIQSLDQNQYLNPQTVKSPQPEQAQVEQQNQKAADSAQEAFRLSISKEGEAMLKASDQEGAEAKDARTKKNIEAESLAKLQTSYSEPDQRASQIVNIVA